MGPKAKFAGGNFRVVLTFSCLIGRNKLDPSGTVHLAKKSLARMLQEILSLTQSMIFKNVLEAPHKVILGVAFYSCCNLLCRMPYSQTGISDFNFSKYDHVITSHAMKFWG